MSVQFGFPGLDKLKAGTGAGSGAGVEDGLVSAVAQAVLPVVTDEEGTGAAGGIGEDYSFVDAVAQAVLPVVTDEEGTGAAGADSEAEEDYSFVDAVAQAVLPVVTDEKGTGAAGGAGAGGIPAEEKPYATQEDLAPIRESLNLNNPEVMGHFRSTMESVAAIINPYFADPTFLTYYLEGLNMVMGSDGTQIPTAEASTPASQVLRVIDMNLLSPVYTTWVDSARTKGLIVGPRITDLKIHALTESDNSMSAVRIHHRLPLPNVIQIAPNRVIDPHVIYTLNEGDVFYELMEVLEQQVSKTYPDIDIPRGFFNPTQGAVRCRNVFSIIPCPPDKKVKIAFSVYTYGTPSIFLVITPDGGVTVRFNRQPHNTDVLVLRDELGRPRVIDVDPQESDPTFSRESVRDVLEGGCAEGLRPPCSGKDAIMVVEIPLKHNLPPSIWRYNFVDPNPQEYDCGYVRMSGQSRSLAVPGHFGEGPIIGTPDEYQPGIEPGFFNPEDGMEVHPDYLPCVTIFNNACVNGIEQITQEVLARATMNLLVANCRKGMSKLVSSYLGELALRCWDDGAGGD